MLLFMVSSEIRGLKKGLQRDSHHVNKILIATPGKMAVSSAHPSLIVENRCGSGRMRCKVRATPQRADQGHRHPQFILGGYLIEAPHRIREPA
jgi:hypothetical protein